jgi:hypothetical protein
MSDTSWQLLVTVFDTLSAQVLSERLNNEGVPTRLQSDSELLGVARACKVLVPAAQMHRARSLLSSEQLSDAELAYLATGEISTDSTEDP